MVKAEETVQYELMRYDIFAQFYASWKCMHWIKHPVVISIRNYVYVFMIC